MATTDKRVLKIVELGKTLRGFEMHMTVLCELDVNTLETLVEECEELLYEKRQAKLAEFYRWVRFVRDMKLLGHVSDLSWQDQRPEHLKMD